VEEKLEYKDCIVKVYGVASGKLPERLRKELNISEFVSVIGIVMRYEGGGSLQSHIYNTNRKQPIPMIEKLRILSCVARGIAELHAAGVIHADIKPDNVLLSSHDPPEIRLADFGLAIMRQGVNMALSSMMQTSHARGTPIYSAPEMLFNPYTSDMSRESVGETVAKPSRKSDVYAFAVLAWELLVEKRPFTHAYNEIVLSSMIHQGQRPSLNDIPKDCPKKVIELIDACWQTDRSRRKFAIECFSNLKYHHGLLSKSVYTLFISHDNSTHSLACNISYRLTQLGYSVFFNQNVHDPDSKDHDELASVSQTKIILILANQTYQNNDRCLQVLKAAKKLKTPPLFIPLFLEPDYLAWSCQELVYLCQLRSTSLVSFDFSTLAQDISWKSEEGPSAEALKSLNISMLELSSFVKEYEKGL
jgi:serine/threonine protein kinase